MVNRIDRVNELIKQELSKILEEHFNFKEVLLTVSYVKTAPDLRTAKVFISVFPFEKSKEIFEKIKEELSKIQQILNQKVKLKYIPKIEVNIDDSFEYGSGIENLIKKIKHDRM